MDDNRNVVKTDYIRFRCEADVKKELIRILRENGDTMSGFFYRFIIKFIRDSKKEEEK